MLHELINDLIAFNLTPFNITCLLTKIYKIKSATRKKIIYKYAINQYRYH
jgi:hypothetical protein